jgi:hypothetical protein
VYLFPSSIRLIIEISKLKIRKHNVLETGPVSLLR